MFLSVIIPAYNEEVRLPSTLAATAAFFQDLYPGEVEILVIDDGSTDGTSIAVQEFLSVNPSVAVRVLSYGNNRGKGYAVRYGMLQSSGQWRLFCDADQATPVEEFRVVWAAMQKDDSDIGIGSRPMKNSKILIHQPSIRENLGRVFNKIVQSLAVKGIEDTQCGFKIFRGTVAQEIFGICRLDGFAFDIEALYVADRLGYTIVEVPIRWSHKDGSKVDMVRDGLRALRDLILIRIMHHNLAPAPLAAEPKQ